MDAKGCTMTRFGFLSSYPPTRCGLATFTQALAAAIAQHPEYDSAVVRVLDEPGAGAVASSPPVVADLVAGDPESIAAAVRALNEFDVVVVQHEYGIYGGEDGDEVIDVLEGLNVPSIVVLHTVLDAPTPGQKQVLERVAELATAVVVMTDVAHGNLGRRFDVDMRKVSVIPHGVSGGLGAVKHKTHHERTVLTWGLIGPGKGLEWGIRAMAELRDLDPAPRYVIVGKTHPKVLASDGEAYRESLTSLVEQLDVGEMVRFVDAYPDGDELAELVSSADVVLLPYDSRVQVTSGVLVEAVSAGKPVVATAFPHAIELLSGGAGILVAHENAAAIAEALRTVFGERGRIDQMVKAASSVRVEQTWDYVAEQYRVLSSRLSSVAA